jgi:hypothetical protein
MDSFPGSGRDPPASSGRLQHRRTGQQRQGRAVITDLEVVVASQLHWFARRIEVVDLVVAVGLRAAAHSIGQLDGEGSEIWEVPDFHGAGGASGWYSGSTVSRSPRIMTLSAWDLASGTRPHRG